MKAILELKFKDTAGIVCTACILNIYKAGMDICVASAPRLPCPDEGRRPDCPLKEVQHGTD